MHPGSTSHPSWTAPAEVRILDFQTTLSEFQAQSQTAAARGEAELRIYNLKKRVLPSYTYCNIGKFGIIVKKDFSEDNSFREKNFLFYTSLTTR